MEYLRRIKIKTNDKKHSLQDMPNKINNENKYCITNEDGKVIFTITLNKYNNSIRPLIICYLKKEIVEGEKPFGRDYLLINLSPESISANIENIAKEFDKFYKEHKDEYVLKNENGEETINRENFKKLKEDFVRYVEPLLEESNIDIEEEWEYQDHLYNYYGNIFEQDINIGDFYKAVNNIEDDNGTKFKVSMRPKKAGVYIVTGTIAQISAFLDELDTGEYLLDENNQVDIELVKKWLNEGILRRSK